MSKKVKNTYRFLLNFIVYSLIFNITSLSALSELARYPTNKEIQTLMPEFKRQIQLNRNFGQDPKKNEIRAFANYWSKIDKVITPFLGTWISSSEVTFIYPSKIKNRVCIIGGGTGDNFSRVFTTGIVSNGKIFTDNRFVLIKQNNFLGIINIYNQRPNIFVLKLVEPVLQPNKYLGNNSKDSQILKKFKAAKCTIK